MTQPDPRDSELVETAASVIGRLVVAVELADMPQITAQIGRLLNAVVKFNNATLRERPSDEALRQAVDRLWR